MNVKDTVISDKNGLLFLKGKRKPWMSHCQMKITLKEKVKMSLPTNDVSALTDIFMSDTESCEEAMSYDELTISYNKLIARNVDRTEMLEKQEDIITRLQDERGDNLAKISELNDEVTQLNCQLKHVEKQVRMMTTGTNVLDDIFEIKNKEEPKSGGFNYKALNRKQQNRNSAYALEDCRIVRKQQYDQQILVDAGTADLTKSKLMLEHSMEHLSFKTKKKPSSWTCHHCKGRGHIRPYCFKFHGQSKQLHQKPPKKKWTQEVLTLG